MMNIMIGYVWKYIVSGLVLTLIYAIGVTLYLGWKCNWNEEILDECLDIFAQMPGYAKFIESSEFKEKYLNKAFLLAIVIWPINITRGLSILPEAIEHIITRINKERV